MKKRNMLVAVCVALVAAAAVAKAENMEVNFDGSAINRQPSSLYGLKRALPDFEAILPVPVDSANGIKNEAILYKLRKTARQTLCNGISAKTIPPFDVNVQLLINDENVEILYNDMQVFFVSALRENKYNTLLESRDSRLIRLLSELNSPSLSQSKQLEELTVCGLVSAVVIHYLWKIIDKVWTQVAVETVELVKQCHTETVEVPDTGSGTTYHSGQGGNSNFDVNKHMR